MSETPTATLETVEPGNVPDFVPAHSPGKDFVFDIMHPLDHLHLPDSDGAIVNNFQEHPQSYLLTTSLTPRLHEVQPDGQFTIGEDCGIYFRYMLPFLSGCRAPDWFCVLGVPPMLDGEIRRSYVLWMEMVAPLLLIEYVSGDGAEERDRTPRTGKFWFYEQAIHAHHYVIFDGFRQTIEAYRLVGGRFQPMEPNVRGRIVIAPLGIELGLWHSTYQQNTGWWLRAWDTVTGEMLPSAEERAERAQAQTEAALEQLDETRSLLRVETERAEAERQRAEAERLRAERLAERLRQAGIDPDSP